MTNQIEKDLMRHTHERLYRWVNDTRNIFRMADLSDAAAVACIMSELIFALFKMTKITGIEGEDFMEIIAKIKKETEAKLE
jgi:hypothetical protein